LILVVSGGGSAASGSMEIPKELRSDERPGAQKLSPGPTFSILILDFGFSIVGSKPKLIRAVFYS
jgi:hypothetical protein